MSRTEQGVGAADVVLDAEKIGRPLGKWNVAADQIANLVDPAGSHAGDRPVVDEERRSLVAHPRAGGEVDADRAVGRNFAALQLQALQHVLEQRETAEHAVRDVVGKQDAVPAAGLVVEERVELDHAVDLGRRDAQTRCDRVGGIGRNPVELLLNLAQDLQQKRGVPAAMVKNPGHDVFGRHCCLVPLPADPVSAN